MTEIETGEGRLYLATVIDLFSRRLPGYAMGERHDAELDVAAPHPAVATRGGDVRGAAALPRRGRPPALRSRLSRSPATWMGSRCRNGSVTVGSAGRSRRRPGAALDRAAVP